MTMPLCMWNYHDWFRSKNIPHVFSIRNTESSIYGVRLRTPQETDGNYALLSEAHSESGYRTVLSFGDDRIFFRELSPFSVMNEISRMHAAIACWEKELIQTHLKHAALETLLESSDPIFHCPITISLCDQLLAVSPRYETEAHTYWTDYLKLSLPELIRIMPPDSSAYSLYASSDPVIIHSPIYRGKQCLLSNLMTEDGKYIRIIAFANVCSFSPGSVHFMQRLSEAVRNVVNAHEELYRKRHIDPKAFFSECASGRRINRNAAFQVLNRLGWRCNDKYTVFEIALRQPSDTLLMDKLYQVLRPVPFSVCVRNSQVVYLVCNCSSTSPDDIAVQICRIVPAKYFIVSQSNLIADFLSIPQLFLQSSETIRHASAAGTSFLSFSEIMTEYILQNIHNHLYARTMIHPAVNYLLEEDRNNQTQFAVSLYEWLRLGCNYNAAAKLLGLHRNTLISRLNRIVELTGITPDDPETRESLLLSFLIARSSRTFADELSQ